MKLFRSGCAVAGAGLLGMGLTSCLNSPDYSTTPSIDFKEVRVTRAYPPDGLPVDTLTFVVDFRDGDGDLGLSPDDLRSPPYSQPANGTRNRNGFNYFLQPYLKNPNTGDFIKFVNSGSFEGEYDGQYPHLYDELKVEPLTGTLRYKLPLTLGSPFYPGDTVRFTISIKDRALHESNVVTTSEIAIQPQ